LPDALELELLITACLWLTVGLGTLILGADELVRWMDLAIVGAFVGLFLILSLALTRRGGGEDQCSEPNDLVNQTVGVRVGALLLGAEAMRHAAEPGPLEEYSMTPKKRP